MSSQPTVCVTRRWAGRDEPDLAEIVRAQNQLLFSGANPTCRVHAVLARAR